MQGYYQDAVKQVLQAYGMTYCHMAEPINEDQIAVIYRLGQYEYFFRISGLEEMQNQRMDTIFALVEGKIIRSKCNGLHRQK